jgi:hypothetical protein
MKALVAIGLALAMASVLHAQDGLRSASLPERPVAAQPPGPADLFRAGPDTYRPRTNRDRPPFDPSPVLSNGSSYWPYLNVPAPEPLRSIERPGATERSRSRFVKREPTADREVVDRPSATFQSVAPPVPVVAKTMYVIPRCYAGDKPPDASIKCDLTKLRTIR